MNVAPCCLNCPNVQKCATREMACGVFAAYSADGEGEYARLRRFGTRATREWFEFVFLKEDDNKSLLTNLLNRATASTPIAETA